MNTSFETKASATKNGDADADAVTCQIASSTIYRCLPRPLFKLDEGVEDGWMDRV